MLHGYDGQGFPVIQEHFDRAMDMAMAEEYNITETGERERVPQKYYDDGGDGIFVYAASQEV